jgi:hypothetical protein
MLPSCSRAAQSCPMNGSLATTCQWPRCSSLWGERCRTSMPRRRVHICLSGVECVPGGEGMTAYVASPSPSLVCWASRACSAHQQNLSSRAVPRVAPVRRMRPRRANALLLRVYYVLSMVRCVARVSRVVM